MNRIYTIILSFVSLIYLYKSDAQIVISELNYHSDSTVNAGDWVELYNVTGAPVDISGWKLVDGNVLNPPYVIPGGTVLAAGERLVLVDNLSRFDSQHPGVPRIGPIGFEFANSGEQVTLKDAADQIKVQFTYQDSLPWNKCADGFGRTLELIDPTVSPSDPSNWRCGCIKGSPGAAFSPCTSETLVISEINYKSLVTQEAGDWIEIWNKTNGSVNLSGYKLRDDNMNHVYTFPGGTTLNPQERIVVFNDAVNFALQHPSVTKKVGPFNFSLDGNGDAIRLYNGSGKLVQSLWYDDDGSWPKCADGEGFTLELKEDFTQSDDISAHSSWFCGCPKGSPGTAFVNFCGAGNDEIALNGTYKVWPNPARDVLYFESLSGVEQYKVVAIDGKVWANGSLTGNTLQINISELPNGIYVLVVENAGRSQQVKWIKY